jgi:tripartite-type tricarboxylate transporter receptor subunit TctC
MPWKSRLGEISTWAGLVSPAGTPPAIVDKIQRAVARAAANPEVSSKLSTFGISAVSSSPAEFDRYIRHELERWSKAFNESGIKLE